VFVTNVADKLCCSGHVLAVFRHPGPHIYNSPPPSTADLKLLVGESQISSPENEARAGSGARNHVGFLSGTVKGRLRRAGTGRRAVGYGRIDSTLILGGKGQDLEYFKIVLKCNEKKK
jgi:hypothetical protein